MLIKGIIMVVVGYGLCYWLNRRAFYRRNAAGVEEFSSYEAATGTRLLEGLGRLLGLLLLVGGLVLAAAGYFARPHQTTGREAAAHTRNSPARPAPKKAW